MEFFFLFQKMEVLRQDVEAMEKEMDELRAYLAETDEQQKEGNIAIDDDVDCMEEGTAVHVKELVWAHCVLFFLMQIYLSNLKFVSSILDWHCGWF